MSARVVESIKN